MGNATSSSRDKYLMMLWVLTIVGFFVRLYMAHVDPFLHIWDERFHALVARNMMDNPFVPMLRANPVFPADHTNWTQNHIWLHKQPLFMWQMAISMKVFGATEYALRYPSVIMGTLMIPMVYQITKFISNDKRVSLITAGLFCFSNFHVELVGGIRSMDHNDLALEFYVLASIWSLVMYEKTKKKYWIVLIGLCSGAAILTKWLIGLFVFLLWGVKILLQIKERNSRNEIIYLLLALFVCCAVFVPWQLYIMNRFPIEAAYEYEFNRRHITEIIEGHSGTIFFYLERFPQLFGEGIFVLIFPGIYLFIKSKKNKQYAIPILLGVLLVFSFFSFLVKSKTISHLFFIAPFMLMFMAYCLSFLIQKLKRNYLVIPFLIGVGVLSCKPEKIILDQSKNNEERNKEIANSLVYKNLSNKLPDSIAIVTNVPDCISLMFYNKRLTAYETFSEAQIEELKKRKLPIAVFKNVSNHQVSPHILNYPYLYILEDSLK
ncbi:MAG: glycosyltransferase family 39 protein [Taibaiella sp.]|jgi:4-amino-4-deoxy-L-arabinose transferase